MDVVTLIAAAMSFWLFIHYCVFPLLWRAKVYYSLRAIPSPGPTNWLDGHLSDMSQLDKTVSRWRRWLKTCPRIMRLRMLYITEIDVVHPETVSVILKTAEPKNKHPYQWLRPWLGNGLLLSSGKRWARDRRLLTRGFHFDILRCYLPIYKQATGIMLDQWAEIGRPNDAATVNVTKCAKPLMMDITLRCIMSIKSNCQLPPEKRGGDDTVRYVDAVEAIAGCMLRRQVTPYLFSDFLFALSPTGRKFRKMKTFCHRVSGSVICERREALAAAEDEEGDEDEAFKGRGIRCLDFLDILLRVRDEDGKGLSDQEIQEQVDTFLLGSHDTTASALQWTLYYLANHPHIQEKCRQEVLKTLDESKELCYEQLSNLPYLAQCVKESMRLSCTVPYINRELTKPLTIDGHEIPAGTMVGIPIVAVHLNPEVWPEPEKFDPDRFSPEESAKRHPFAFIPFSAGPRNCIGQSLAMDAVKAVLALTLLRFRLTYDASLPNHDLEVMTEMVSRPINDIEICIEEI